MEHLREKTIIVDGEKITLYQDDYICPILKVQGRMEKNGKINYVLIKEEQFIDEYGTPTKVTETIGWY